MHIISGRFKNRTVHTPKVDSTRPTASRLRETLFNICQNYIEDARFLDLFAGSGAIGLEALSRGAKHAGFVDMNKSALESIKKNVQTFGVEGETQVYFGDVLQVIKRLNTPYTIIYADPPYNQQLSQKLLDWIDTSSLLAVGGMLFIEEAHLLETEHLKNLTLVSERKSGKSYLQQFERIS